MMMVFNFRDIITMIRVINGGHDHNHSETYMKDNCKDQDNHDVEHNKRAGIQHDKHAANQHNEQAITKVSGG